MPLPLRHLLITIELLSFCVRKRNPYVNPYDFLRTGRDADARAIQWMHNTSISDKSDSENRPC